MSSASLSKTQFQDLKAVNAPLESALMEAAGRVIRSGRYLHGPEVEAFEKAFAAKCGADWCVAVSNGLDALRLIFRSYMELGRLHNGDEVIIPANTFIATFLAVTDCGLTAVAADVDSATFCLDWDRLPLTDKTRAVVPVHLYGRPCWDSERVESLRSRGILVIEDNAQAVGAAVGGRPTGSLGDAAAVSFYPAKNIGALGDAGAVLTDDASLARKVRELANYGSSEKYRHLSCGFNCRMDELQAAFLSVKLPLLDSENERRVRMARLYDSLITNPDVTKPSLSSPNDVNVWHQYVIRHPRRDALRRWLADNGVGTEIHYPVACHLQPCYDNHPLLSTYSPLPVSERLATEIISLPIAAVTDDEVRKTAILINEFYGRSSQ